MRTFLHIRSFLCLVAIIFAIGVLAVDSARAQGSIFGLLQYSDDTTPPDSAILFFGFLKNTDNELRTHNCIGAGNDGGYWHDDFQNFQGAAVGDQFQYFFFDTIRTESEMILSTIQDNSYQREDVILQAVSFPGLPTGLQAIKQGDDTVLVLWDSVANTTWHVYRRTRPSAGSFFRIDNPSGNLADPGVPQASYQDLTVVPEAAYDYIVIAENTSGNFSPASAVATIDLVDCCVGHVGDVNGVGGDTPSIGDVALLVDHLFISYTEPTCLREADINQSGGLNPTFDDITIGDVALLIDHLFISYTDPLLCSDAGAR